MYKLKVGTYWVLFIEPLVQQQTCRQLEILLMPLLMTLLSLVLRWLKYAQRIARVNAAMKSGQQRMTGNWVCRTEWSAIQCEHR